MKKPLTLLLLLVVILAACNTIKDPEFRKLESFKVKNLGLQQVELAFKVTYFNPNSFGVTVKEAAADVYVDSVFVGKFSQDEEIFVSNQSDFSIPFSGSVPLANALKLKVSDLSKREVFVKADGSVKIGKAGLFITRPFIYQGKHRVDLKL